MQARTACASCPAGMQGGMQARPGCTSCPALMPLCPFLLRNHPDHVPDGMSTARRCTLVTPVIHPCVAVAQGRPRSKTTEDLPGPGQYEAWARR